MIRARALSFRTAPACHGGWPCARRIAQCNRAGFVPPFGIADTRDIRATASPHGVGNT